MKRGVVISIARDSRFGRARAWVARRITWLACIVEGTHFWTAPMRLQELGGRRARICSRCGRVGKAFFKPN